MKLSRIFLAAFVLGVALTATGCSKTDKTSLINIDIMPSNKNLGNIFDVTRPIPVDFEIANHSKDPIDIRRITASCGCTRVEYPQSPLLGGQVAHFRAIVDPASKRGPFSVKLYLEFNVNGADSKMKNLSKLISIVGNVSEAVQVSPVAIRIDKFKPDVKQTVTIFATPSFGMIASVNAAKTGKVITQLLPVQFPTREFKLDISYPKSSPSDSSSTENLTLDLISTSGVKTTINVPVLEFAKMPRLSPDKITELSLSNSITRDIVLDRVVDRKSIVVTSSDPNIKISIKDWRKQDSNTHFSMQISNFGQDLSFYLRFNLPGETEITVPVNISRL